MGSRPSRGRDARHAQIRPAPKFTAAQGLLYFTTGNAAPDYNGSQRAGDNLFTVSMLALEVATGKYRWHFQQVHHDIWDYDSPNPVILFDAPYAGVMRKGIAEVSKTGWAYILDRETGKPLTPIEERPVPQEPRNRTAATQPFVIGDSVVPQQNTAMPPFRGTLTAEQVRNVAHYISSELFASHAR